MIVTPATNLVTGDEALAAFRQRLSGPAVLHRLNTAGGRLLVGLPVGVGKSYCLDAVAAYAAATEPDTLVLVTAPRTDILKETRQRLRGHGLAPVVLRPRPSRHCGVLDGEWAALEKLNCSAFARRTVCGRCPRQATCHWLRRWQELAGCRLVLAAQQHLANDPDFVPRLRVATGAARVLVLVDESDLLLRPFRRDVSGPDLDRFALAAAAVGGPAGTAWAAACRALLAATQADLFAPWTFPAITPAFAADTAAAGRAASGQDFRFVGHDLRQFGRSDRSTRERTLDGGVRFAHPPDLGDRAVIFSGSAAAGLVHFRLDPDHRRGPITAPFAGYQFTHPDTRWYNLANAAGTAQYFPGNAGRVLDVFARLVAGNIANGRRTLLVCRKRFLRLCRAEIHRRVAALAGQPVRVVTKKWKRHDLTDPRTIPLITYGVSGINRFEHHDAVYCLTGYYVAPAAVAALVNDLEPSDRRFEVKLTFQTRPPRRAATISDPTAATTIAPSLAGWALEQKEADVVVQAVGRVRPFTRPREVVTFQVGDLPGVTYHRVFGSLADLRTHFDLSTPAAATAAGRIAAVAQFKAVGKTKREIAAALGVSPKTVKRLLKKLRGGGGQSVS